MTATPTITATRTVTATVTPRLCAYGAGENLPSGTTSFTTAELETNFLGTVGVGGAIAGEATPAHRGRTPQAWAAVVSNEQTGKAIALFRCTQIIRYRRA